MIRKHTRRSLLKYEPLENRRLLAELSGTALDVNSDGVIAPVDALLVANQIGTHNAIVDLDGDGIVTAADAQLVLDSLDATAVDAAIAVAPCSDPTTLASSGANSAMERTLGCGCQVDEVPDYVPDFPGNDPNDPPDEYSEWRGDGEPGSSEGAWYNPDTGESLHPDLENEGEGAHWDYNYPGPPKEKWRIFPDGRKEKDCK